jgi:hypothetical protein
MVKLVFIVDTLINPLQYPNDAINHFLHYTIHCSVFILKNSFVVYSSQTYMTNLRITKWNLFELILCHLEHLKGWT